MVKKGPCSHCGIHFTPLWRNGPAEKPVLCNACGSRYKSKGNLDNYFPKNAQNQLCLNNYDGSNLNVEEKLEFSNDVLGEGSGNNSANSGGISPNLWNSKIPSKKRSVAVYKRMTPMEKFYKQLLGLSRDQRQSNESFSEEVLLLDNVNNFIPEDEIGLGGVLLKPDFICKSADQGSSI